MAAKQAKGSKFGRQSRNSCDAGQKARTTRNKQAEIARHGKLMSRPDEDVSSNCLKKRQKRERRREFKSIFGRDAHRHESPSQAGQRQFGERAKPWHLHQREMGLATALTPKEWQEKEKREKQARKENAGKSPGGIVVKA